jgi:hypothetical protein
MVFSPPESLTALVWQFLLIFAISFFLPPAPWVRASSAPLQALHPLALGFEAAALFGYASNRPAPSLLPNRFLSFCGANFRGWRIFHHRARPTTGVFKNYRVL